MQRTFRLVLTDLSAKTIERWGCLMSCRLAKMVKKVWIALAFIKNSQR